MKQQYETPDMFVADIEVRTDDLVMTSNNEKTSGKELDFSGWLD